MGGVIIPILQTRRFDYGYLGSSASQEVTLEPAICAVGYYFISIHVRVHERNMAPGQTFVFSLFNTLPAEDDSREFSDPAVSPILTVTVTSANPTAVPGLWYGDGRLPGPYLKATLTATQPVPAVSPFFAQMSAVLMMSEP